MRSSFDVLNSAGAPAGTLVTAITDRDNGIKTSLNAYVASRCTPHELTADLTAICDSDEDSTWEVLSYLDQYHRRHLLPTPVFESIKDTLSARALKIAAPATTPDAMAVRQPSLPAAGGHRPPTSGPATAATHRFRVGSVLLDRYELTGPILRGGFGCLHRALDRDRINLPHQERYVAIKSLHDDLPGPIACGVLQHEFLQTRQLSHPNVANVYDFEMAGEHGFIVMELAEGELLSRLIERLAPRRLPPPFAFAIIREMGLALLCAHEHAVAHGDVQPRNVVVTHTGELRLMNFGQASTLRRLPWLSESLDHSGLRMLTSAYCSPEIHKGIGADARDDLFGLACMMYELFAGHPPFAVGEWLRIDELPRPKHLHRKQWRALQHGLAYDRHDRPANIHDWLDQLDLREAAERLPLLEHIGRHCR